jgi:hypothetical protein
MGAADWLVVAAGSAWVAGLGDDGEQVGQLHGQTGKVLNTVTVPSPVCMGMDVGYGSVWAATCAPASVTRIDPKTAKVQARITMDTDVLAKVVATIQVSAGPISGGDIAVGGGSVWARATDPLAARIDPATNKVTASYGPVSGSGGVAADDSAAWFAAHDIQTVWRLPLS